METILRGLLVMATAGALVFPSVPPAATNSVSSASRGRVVAPVAPVTPTAASFAANQVEAYMTDDGIAYVRPGVKIKISSITNVVAGQKPVVDFYLTDNFDQPLDRLGQVTPGPIAPGFILSKWDATTRYYKTYTLRTRNGVTNPAADQGGTYTDLAVGHYKYTFGTAMPTEVTPTTTLTLGAYARRTLTDIIGKDYYADNILMDFRPDGGAADKTWGAMAVANSCNKCHDPLGLHGGTRRDVELCMQCHNQQVQKDSTSGESFDGKIFFHKLHNAANLPSGKPYIAGGDWSGMTYPQDIRNCTTCHDTTAAEASIWLTRPTRAVCGSCHDNIDWVKGTNHPGGPAADDIGCPKCHIADSGKEFDASIKGAHVIPTKSAQLKGLKATIVSVSNAKPGSKPTVVFKFTNNDGTAVDGSKLNRFGPFFAGPTTSYASMVRETTRATAAVFDATAGTTTYTFDGIIPATATGSLLFSGDFYRNVTIKRNDGGADVSVREAAVNPLKYVAITGTTATPRRTSANLAGCNACHDVLALHGGQRYLIDECVACHTPATTDTATPAESVSFQRMIHRIHTGEELTQTYKIGTAVYNEVLFPGDRRNCAKCHTSTGYALPLPTGIDAVTTPTDYFSPQGPGTAACLGCHDNRDAAAHAYLNTTNFGGKNSAEACATCHGNGKDWGVDKVHAR